MTDEQIPDMFKVLTPHWYRLVGREVERCTLLESCKDIGTRVGREEREGIYVSTVFLGFDHGIGKQRQLFETMVFREGKTESCWRYPTWESAEAGHERACREVFARGGAR